LLCFLTLPLQRCSELNLRIIQKFSLLF
jgi:hypothetical protein